MILYLDTRREKLSQFLKRKTTMDFSDWATFVLFVLGSIVIFLLRLDMKDTVSALLLWFTAIVISQYTKETYWLKQTSTRQLKEQIKDRHIREIPFLKALSLESKARPVDPEFIKEHPKDTGYYEVKVVNESKFIAYITAVKLWEGNPLPEQEVVQSTDLMRSVYPNDSYSIIHYTQEKEDGKYVFPVKIEITYKDRYGNSIVYEAQLKHELAPPTPWLGIRPFIDHKHTFPPELS